MFAKAIIGSARFLTMPPSSRLLYYDLGMAADDDGVVEAFTVMRTTGAVEDDLRVLVSKGFVLVLNDELVSFIVDWSKNNQIRKDRYQPSIYTGLLVKMDDGNQRLTDGQPNGNQRLTDGQPNGNQRLTQYSLVKNSLGKSSIGEENRADKPPRTRFSPPSIDEVIAYCLERGNTVDAEQFLNFYSANGWKQGKGKPIVDWRAAVRTWERRGESKAESKKAFVYDYGDMTGSL